MKSANDLSGYSISDLVKIVNDYEQQKTFLEEQEETIAELRAENIKLEERAHKAENKVFELQDRLSGDDNDHND